MILKAIFKHKRDALSTIKIRLQYYKNQFRVFTEIKTCAIEEIIKKTTRLWINPFFFFSLFGASLFIKKQTVSRLFFILPPHSL